MVHFMCVHICILVTLGIGLVIFIMYTFLLLYYFPDENVSSPSLLGMNFSNHGKDAITVRNLLLHNAGFPPDPDPLYCKHSFCQ